MTTSSALLNRLAELNEVGIALSKVRDTEQLLAQILSAAMRITNADAGTLYTRTAADTLAFKMMRTTSLNLALGGLGEPPISLPSIALYDESGLPNEQMVVSHAVLHDATVNIADAYQADGFDFSGTRAFDAITGYRSQSFLTVPLKNHENDIIGVLQLINAQDFTTQAVCIFDTAAQQLVESLASQAAIAWTNQLLINQLEQLFESLIKLINTAIDEKSPHTGQHCARVPELTMRLAEAVHHSDAPELAGFRMSERDRYELKIAGLLHDCGKITTPVHVVDKATKLHTLFDRIELIDTRFEVLKRDAKIAYLQAGEQNSAAKQQYQQQLAQIDADKCFLHQVNRGAESMADADMLRVQQIANIVWQDTQGNLTTFLTTNELENLTIRRGTLTASERQVINEHITTTINMLNSLPWPKHLKNVPEYAGGHHERMDGKGYPRGLLGSQMPIQARIMAIADIFEALTARDRPYKQGNTLSEALHMLGRMCLNGHIDPDLFDVFIRAKVYLQYAEQFLEAYQIDAVDEAMIPGYVA
ncbi:MAG: GAF domain-containing protein [Sulfuriferula sp.]|nr:GAF domain-containing protein [Sulfuriferula sp.]